MKLLTPILLTLLAVAVIGLDDNLATESKAKAQKVAHSSRLANQLKTQDVGYLYRHDNGYRPSNVQHDKYNQLHSNYEAPKLQYGPFGSTKNYNPQPSYNPYVPVYPETPYSHPQTSNYDSSSYIYPLSYYTESPTYAYPQQSYPSPGYYSPSVYVPQAYTEAPYPATSDLQYPPLYYKDLKKVQRPFDAVTVSRPTEHAASNHNGYTNNYDEYVNIPNEYAHNPNEYPNIPNGHSNNQNEYSNIHNGYCINQNEYAKHPNKFVGIPNKHASSHSEYATGNTQNGYRNNFNKYASIPSKYASTIPNKYANSHNEFENSANDFPKFDDFLKHSLNQFPNYRY
jgi:hypothetical protein